jgi:hypothetical protein
MKLAVTDACIFIDLIELQLISVFFSLPIEIHTSLDVFNELYNNQKEILRAYQSVGKLSVHNITSEEKTIIQKGSFPKSLSENDKSVIFLAEKLNAMVLSSDKAVRKFAKLKAIEYHGMLWIFEKLIEFNKLTPAKAINKIDELVSGNIVYQNNVELTDEIEKRKRIWTRRK